jgi:hypothetical protein
MLAMSLPFGKKKNATPNESTWAKASCSLLTFNRRLGGTYTGDIFLWSLGSDSRALYPRR